MRLNLWFSSWDDGWIVSDIDRPGCSAIGDSVQDALTELSDAQAAWDEACAKAGNPPANDFDISKLVRFADACLEAAFEGRDFDGGDIQELALTLGLLKTVPFDPKVHDPGGLDVKAG